MKHLVAPSILSADFARLGEETDMINGSEADWFHVDVMDGVFVPNISLGFPVVKAISSRASKPLDVHLMIVQPERYIEEFRQAGAGVLTVHLEASTHLHRTVAAIKQAGMKAGVALNPHSPIHLLQDIIADIDLVCLMAVNPGFGGQKFIPGTIRKIKELKRLISEHRSSALIEIDGGVSQENAKSLLQAGADVLVAGNAVFSAQDPRLAIKNLKNIDPGTQEA